MRDFLVVKDPEVAKLFADPCRRSILHNVRHYEMTPYQLAKALGKNVSSVIHHLNALEKADLVEQSRSVVKGNLIEKFYRATAKVFIISYTLSEGLVPGSDDIAKWSKEICRRAASNLAAFFPDRLSAEQMDKLTELIERYVFLEKVACEEVIAKQRSPIHIERPALKLLVNVLTHVYLCRNPQYIEVVEGISRELGRKEEKL